MKVAIHQPNYLPWLPFFDKMSKVDVFVVSDLDQYSNNDFHNRVKIKSDKGFFYLTIPIRRNQVFKKINEVFLPEDNFWIKRHWKSIIASYSSTPYFNEHKEGLEKIFKNNFKKLIDLNLEFIKYCKEQFKFKNEIVLDSSLNIESGYNKVEKLLFTVKKLEADSLLLG